MLPGRQMPAWGARARAWFGVLGVPVTIVLLLGVVGASLPIDRAAGAIVVSALLAAWGLSGLVWLAAEMVTGFGDTS